MLINSMEVFSLSGVFIILFVSISLIILISALRNSILRKIGFRNVTRRLGNTILVVVGSMVGTALISGSLVLSDSFDKTFLNLVQEQVGEIDASVIVNNTSPSPDPIALSTLSQSEYIAGKLSEMEQLDGVLPVINLSVSPQKLDAASKPVISSYNANLFGVNFDTLAEFGQNPQKISPPAKENGVIMSESLADQLEAQVGDDIRVSFDETAIDLVVSDIKPDEGIYGGKKILVSEDFLRSRLDIPVGRYTNFLVSIDGGIEPENYEGEEFKKNLEAQLKEYHSDNNEVIVNELKSQALNGFGLGFFSTIFLVLSFFGVFSGLLLIINLYTMLAEERKYEMGILRAVAMTRWQLMRTFIYEGYLYTIISSLVGTLVGIGIGYLLINVFSSLFSDLFSTAGEDEILSFAFGVEWDSLIIAFSLGSVITIITAILASYRISKLNIVAAIRDTVEEKKLKLSVKWLLGTIAIAFMLTNSIVNLVFAFLAEDFLKSMREGALEANPDSQLALMSDSRFSEIVKLMEGYSLYIGVVLTILFSAWLLNRIVRLATDKDYSRYILSLANLIAVLFTAAIGEIKMIADALILNEGTALLFTTSMVLVISFSILVSLNLDIFASLTAWMLKTIPNSSSIIKIAMRYPAANRSRTGLTLTMFALIIYLIVFISVNKAIVNDQQNSSVSRTLGGYELLIYPMPDVKTNQLNNMLTEIESVDNVDDAVTLSDIQVVLPEYKYKDIPKYPYFGDPAREPRYKEEDSFKTVLNALPGDFILNSDVELAERATGYKNDDEVWEAVVKDKTKVVIGTAFVADSLGPRPVLKVGDKIKIADQFEQVSYEAEIIGQTKVDFNSATTTGFFNYIVTERAAVEKELGKEYVDKASINTVIVNIGENGSKRDTVNAVKKAIIAYNLAAVIELDDLLGASQSFVNGIFLMLQGFLAFSLIIGTSGLAIIIARSVNERRQQIGMLRSLGFQRGMILGSFFIESTFITVLSLIIGISMGLVGMSTLVSVVKTIAPDYRLVVPWGELAALVVIVYVAAILFSLLPSFKAARLSPVEATNYPE